MKSYHAFLVRCWCESNSSGLDVSDWRFSVMQIGATTQAPRGFSNFDALTRYILDEIGGSIREENQLPDETPDSQKDSDS